MAKAMNKENVFALELKGKGKTLDEVVAMTADKFKVTDKKKLGSLRLGIRKTVFGIASVPRGAKKTAKKAAKAVEKASTPVKKGVFLLLDEAHNRLLQIKKERAGLDNEEKRLQEKMTSLLAKASEVCPALKVAK